MTSLCKKKKILNLWRWTKNMFDIPKPHNGKSFLSGGFFPLCYFCCFFKVFLRSNLYQCPFPLSSIYFILQWTKILKKDKCLILLLLLISGPASSTRFNIPVDFKTDLCFLHLNIHSLCAMVMLSI